MNRIKLCPGFTVVTAPALALPSRISARGEQHQMLARGKLEEEK